MICLGSPTDCIILCRIIGWLMSVVDCNHCSCCLSAAGDLELLQRALQSSGTDALAALQANTYRLPSARATEARWNRALQEVASAAATHSTGSYAYYMVTQSGF